LNPTAYLTVELDSLLRDIDYTELNNAIISVPGAENKPTFVYREIEDCILTAANTWLARDLQSFSAIEVEKSYLDGKVIIDLIGVNRGTLAPFNKYPDGSLVMLDWKSSANPVDTDTFKRRYLGSFQWQRYASCEPSTVLFIYRGISRSLDYRKRGDSFEPASRTRELILKVHPGTQEDVTNQWDATKLMRDSLINISPWSKNRDACYDFGAECPYMTPCYASTTPLIIPTFSPILSYSKMSLFLRCPERYRLTLIDEQTEQDSDSTEEEDRRTLPGSMIHAGLANLWQQAFRNRK